MNTHKVIGTKSHIEIRRLENVTACCKGTKTLKFGGFPNHRTSRHYLFSLSLSVELEDTSQAGRQAPVGKTVRAEELESPWSCVTLACVRERNQGTKMVSSGTCG